MANQAPAKTQSIKLYGKGPNLFKKGAEGEPGKKGEESQNPKDQAVASANSAESEDRKKPGRKRIEEELLDKPITINFTKSEKEKLDELQKKYLGAPITQIIRSALKEQGII